MGGVSPAVWLVVSLVLVAGMLAGFLSQRGRRRRALSHAADLRGWVVKGSQISLARRWPGEPFLEGTRQEAHDIVSGTAAGVPFTSLQYLVARPGAATAPGDRVPLSPVHVIVIPVPDDAAAAALPTTPTEVGEGWSARRHDHEIVTWRDGDQDLDAIEPAVTRALAWSRSASA